MVAKFMFLMVLSWAIQLEAYGCLPVIHIISAVSSPQININLKAGGLAKGSARLSRGQTYQINVEMNDVYYATAVFGLRFTAFHAYEPARDGGQAAIYWKVDKGGFSLSYDNITWTKDVAAWESE